jgi:hypothetical protein
MKKSIIEHLKNLLAYFFYMFSKKKVSSNYNEVAELKIKIEEVPNENILIYHISDVLTKKKWSFESEKDLQYGGLHSINFEKVEVPEELQYLAGNFLLSVNGLKKVDFSQYEISFEKSPVFDWKDMEKEIIPIIQKMIAKKRKMVIKQRVKLSISVRGSSVYTEIN